MKLYKNAKIFTLDPKAFYYESGYIVVENDRIKEIGPMESLKDEDKYTKKEDLHGKIVMPGMISAHSHFYGQFVRGMQLGETISNWQQVLSRMWWKVDKKLTLEQSYCSALMGLIEGLKSGTTTYFDHQASPNSTDGVLDVIKKAVLECGARACLSYEVSDRDGNEHALSGIHENERFIKECEKEKLPQISAMFGLHASYTLSDDTLEKAAEVEDQYKCGFHIHAAEDRADISESYRLYDKHVIPRLCERGILNDRSIAAHCVWVRDKQIDMLRDCGVFAAHNGQSNTNNAVGISPVVRMLEKGVKVVLGGDGYTYDLFRELSFDVILQRLREEDPGVFSPDEIYKMAFYNNEELVKRHFGVSAGVLKKDSFVDFIVLDYDAPTPIDGDNFLSHMLSSFSGMVNTVICGGREVVRDGKCTFVDEEEVFARCREESRKLWASL